MEILDTIDKRDLKELLVKNWMTHDAMWLYHCLNHCGVDTMNTVNQAAVRSMAAVEIQRIKKAMGVPKDKRIEGFRELADIMYGAFDLVKGDFMDFSWEELEGDRLAWSWNKCFAYDGIKGLGLLDSYRCGIILRVSTWLDTLGVKYEIDPLPGICLMHTRGACRGEYRFFF